nr:DHHA1 domain-containing protein [Candidatus Syntrophosphaera sp.]
PTQANSIENIVNAAIRDNRPVSVEVKSIAEARSEGAIALFGEKYAERVRVVSVAGFSKELCGGTHVAASGEIGFFKIISESSSAAGIRRIEALTGRAAEQFVLGLQHHLALLAEKLHVPEKMLDTKLEALQNRVLELEQQLKRLDAQQCGAEAAELIRGTLDLGDFKLLSVKLDADAAKLRELGDSLKDHAADAIALLFSVSAGKVTLLCVVGEALRPKFHAGNIVKAVSARLEGKGGGRPDSAMGGGSRPELLDSVIADLPQIIRSASQ